MAALYPASVTRLIEEFGKLPGVGKRSAERMAYHVLAAGREEAMGLAVAIRDVKKNIRACERCFHVAEGSLCTICADASRDGSTVCVVELPRDVIAIEKMEAYRGVYHVLQGRLSPADGVGPGALRIRELVRRVRESEDPAVGEVILALNPSVEGDATAAHLAELLSGEDVRVSRLARGLSSGADLESAPPSTLQFALEGRQELSRGEG